MQRSEEEIREELERVSAELKELEGLPAKYSVHGQSIDNTDRLEWLRTRVRQLNAELEGKSVMQGPDLII